MLASLTVSNFKGFNSDFTFNLKETNGFQFNTECIKNGLINSALVYGYNAVGKSNLGFALFDLVTHLTDKHFKETDYSQHTYLNASSNSDKAKFYFEFLFDGNTVTYGYEKTSVRTLLVEEFCINGKTLAYIDKNVSNHAVIGFEGAETLNKELTNSNLSLLKYIRNNSVLNENEENEILNKFFVFVDSMLFFSSAYGNSFLGFENTGFVGRIEEDIISKNNVIDFENFLQKAGIVCNIKVIEELEKKKLAFDFNGKLLSFYEIASSGTKALTLFYMWRQRFKIDKSVSFLFIDEFDSYYHHELAAFIVEELKQTGVQFVLTSHNTSIITNELLRPDCYFLMKKDSIKSLAQSTPKELREAHNIEKMYKAGTFNG
ncbi:MAG: hypothetical protein RI922_1840 [Bacteroidota bacterium]